MKYLGKMSLWCLFVTTGFLLSCASTTFVTPIGNLTYEPNLSPVIGVDSQGQELGVGFSNGLLLTGDHLYLNSDQNIKNMDTVAERFLPETPNPEDIIEEETIEHAAVMQDSSASVPLLIENADEGLDSPMESAPPPVGSLDKQKELTLLAMCVYGESRSEPYEGKLSIACVVMNRVKEQGWFGKTVKEVLLKPYQFTCFSKSDPNFKKLFKPEPGLWKQCFKAAWNAYSSLSDDPTLGSNHYCRRDVAPPWKKILEFKKEIGNHMFFKSSPTAVVEWWYTHYMDRNVPRAFLINEYLSQEFFKLNYLVNEYEAANPPKKTMKI
jgi:N-acetylmuramoyl-L-alanine amidase